MDATFLSFILLNIPSEEKPIFSRGGIPFIAREIEAYGIAELWPSSTYAISLPANSATLTEAASQRLVEPLIAFILISACVW